MKFLLVIFIFFYNFLAANAQVYQLKTGHVYFHSVATKELVSAFSNDLYGLIDVNKKVFVIKIPLISFLGFNTPLQREHFNENYLESDIFPNATFVGKIIENIDVNKEGDYLVRAKGKMNIHGVELDLIIKTLVSIKEGKVIVHSDFPILLADFNIKIPRIVYEKIATEVSVTVNAVFVKKEMK